MQPSIVHYEKALSALTVIRDTRDTVAERLDAANNFCYARRQIETAKLAALEIGILPTVGRLLVESFSLMRSLCAEKRLDFPLEGIVRRYEIINGIDGTES